MSNKGGLQTTLYSKLSWAIWGGRGSLRIGRKDKIPKKFVKGFLQKQHYHHRKIFQIYNYIWEIIYSHSKPVISNLKIKPEDSSPFD